MHYPLVPVPCGHCRAITLPTGVDHQATCPRAPANHEFFTHPDLMDLESHLTAYYPEA